MMTLYCWFKERKTPGVNFTSNLLHRNVLPENECLIGILLREALSLGKTPDFH